MPPSKQVQIKKNPLTFFAVCFFLPIVNYCFFDFFNFVMHFSFFIFALILFASIYVDFASNPFLSGALTNHMTHFMTLSHVNNPLFFITITFSSFKNFS